MAYNPENPCRTCVHWKWHSRLDEPEPMFSVGFHYCEASNTHDKKTRLAICRANGYYQAKKQLKAL